MSADSERQNRYRVAVLASGGGTNFQSLLDRFTVEDSPVDMALLIASRPGIHSIERARRKDVEAVVLPEQLRVPVRESREEDEAAFILGELARVEADLVVLAGYLRLIPVGVVRAYWGRMINIHPALLPSHHVHEAVLDSGARVSGVTVHFVDEEYDRGPIVAQWPVPVLDGDDPDALAARVLRVEHRILPAVVEALARGWVELGPDRRCVWSRPWFAGERFAAVPADPTG
jgi:formyltetrahydrofolate-dependent phosphoribosylglycinamide formyltransferase